MNKIQEMILWKPLTGKLDNSEYEKSWYCNENKIVHSTFKQYLKCSHCVNENDKKDFEKERRAFFLSWHYLGESYLHTPLEIICQSYNVKLQYFRPWI